MCRVEPLLAGLWAHLVLGEPYTWRHVVGMVIVAAAIDWKKGDNVVLCAELEHPNNVYAWLNLRRHGVDVRTVPARDGHIPIDALVSRMDARTRVATVSTVSFAPGFRTDVLSLLKTVDLVGLSAVDYVEKYTPFKGEFYSLTLFAGLSLMFLSSARRAHLWCSIT